MPSSTTPTSSISHDILDQLNILIEATAFGDERIGISTVVPHELKRVDKEDEEVTAEHQGRRWSGRKVV